MDSEEKSISVRFEYRWLAAPLALVIVAVLFIYFFPVNDNSPPSLPTETPLQPLMGAAPIDVEKAKEWALAQCAHEYDCTQKDCLEKVLTHVDASIKTIEAVLRTPAPRELRDHLRKAIKRGVNVKLILDPALNSAFFLEGAEIRMKRVSKFIASNFMAIDREMVVYGSNSQIYAAAPDVIKVACEGAERDSYFFIFDKVWKNDSTSYMSQTDEEEILADSELGVSGNDASVCDAAACGPDSFSCSGTTKIWENYFCESACVYETILLYYSPECGYSTPGFGPDGNSLVVISETEVDEGQISSEFIEFASLQPLELSGFSLLKNGVLLTTFPTPYILNGSAKVYTGSGANTPTTIYLNELTPLWKTPGTTATLVNPDWVPVASKTFEG
jgi:hypothetical protein